MASKTISRILNRSSECSIMSSFDDKDESENSFSSFYFDKADVAGENEADIREEKTDCCYYPEQERKELSSSSDRPIFEEFEKEKKFLGIITNVDVINRTFSANLICPDDLVTRDVLFSMDDLSPIDISLVEVGRRIIYIYGKQYRNGTVSNVSNLYFRRNSNWTEREIESKRNEAAELYAMMK